MCARVGVLSAAIAGYVIGGLTGSALASWLLAVAGALAMLAWSRAGQRRGGGASCPVPRARRRPALPVAREPLAAASAEARRLAAIGHGREPSMEPPSPGS